MSRLAFEDFVPHSAPMALLDFVEQWSDDSLEASVTIRPDAPFAEAQGVPAWVGIEYMAQAIGAYAGVHARENNEAIKIGFLVGCRRYTCNQQFFPLGEHFTVRVKRDIQGDNGLNLFECEILGDNLVAKANLSVFQPTDPDSFLGGNS